MWSKFRIETFFSWWMSAYMRLSHLLALYAPPVVVPIRHAELKKVYMREDDYYPNEYCEAIYTNKREMWRQLPSCLFTKRCLLYNAPACVSLNQQKGFFSFSKRIGTTWDATRNALSPTVKRGKLRAASFRCLCGRRLGVLVAD